MSQIVLKLELLPDEFSVVRLAPGWRCLRVSGPLDFEMTGVLSALSSPLARAGIPIFVLSTYNTDYLLVKSVSLQQSLTVLRDSGYLVVDNPDN